VNVIAIQFDIAWENKSANFTTVSRFLTEAKPEKRSLVVLPEMFATGFSMNAGEIAEPPGGPVEQFLSGVAKERGIYILAGKAARGRDGSARNKALVFGPSGDLLAFYAKMRLFSPGGEPGHYVPGERILVFEWEGCRVAPFVCYDLRFPELFRQAAAARRPELFAVIANFPTKRIQHWIRLLQARAIENQAYVVGVNRVGADPTHTYGGRSLIVDPQGEILADAGTQEGTIQAPLELDKLAQYRRGLPFLADMRV